MYLSDEDYMEPLAWSLLKHGADPETPETESEVNAKTMTTVIIIRQQHYNTE